MKVDYVTDIGAVRSSNQDACDCGLLSGGSAAWAVVCDGMGGANGGNVASAVAVEKIREFVLSEFREDMDPENLKSLLINAVNRANDAVHAKAEEQEELRGMGTTVVLMIASGGLLHVAHVGDSRAYLKNSCGLTQITMDHSYVQDLVNFGQITREEARVHPRRNIITRVLGVHESVRCDYTSYAFSSGDVALACSDGLSNYTEDSLLEEYIETHGSTEKELAQDLVQYALECGGADNITVAVLKNE